MTDTIYSKISDHARHMAASLRELRDELADNGTNTLVRIRLLLSAEFLEEIEQEAQSLHEATLIGQGADQ